jgi:hypothetical protein
MIPHELPEQPWPATALPMLHATPVFDEPVTCAKNWRVLPGCPAGGRNAKPGETLMDTEAGGAMITCALPNTDGATSLVATRVTTLGEGTTAGARKSTLPEIAACGAAHGLEPKRQISPTVVSPLTIPFTVQLTAVFVAFATMALNAARWPTETLAELGVTVTEIFALIVTVAVADCDGFDWLAARIVTGFDGGRLFGAMYVARFVPVFVIVPTMGLPPMMPFTSHVICVPGGTQSMAVKLCDWPTAALAVAGEIEFEEQRIFTPAFATAEGSAALVAFTLTVGGEGIVAGAV